jgi:hypothetical protein
MECSKPQDERFSKPIVPTVLANDVSVTVVFGVGAAGGSQLLLGGQHCAWTRTSRPGSADDVGLSAVDRRGGTTDRSHYHSGTGLMGFVDAQTVTSWLISA